MSATVIWLIQRISTTALMPLFSACCYSLIDCKGTTTEDLMSNPRISYLTPFRTCSYVNRTENVDNSS